MKYSLMKVIGMLAIASLITFGCEQVNSPNQETGTNVVSSEIATANNHTGIVYVDATNTSGTEDGSQTNPYDTIQEGVDHAGPGETVQVASGTYNESVSIDKPLLLLGPNSTTSAVSGPRVAEAVIKKQIVINTTSDVEVSGFELSDIDSPNFTIYVIGDSNGFTFKNNRFIDNGQVAIKTPLTLATENITIEGNLISGVTGSNQSGLLLGGVSGTSVIAGNKIIDTAYGGIVIDGAVGLTISDNEIENIPQQGIQLAGIVSDATIIDNTITNANTEQKTDKGAIRIYGSDFTGSVLIKNNTISGGHNGIAIKDGKDITGKDIVIAFNDILAPNSGAQIYHGGTGKLNVENNWWGVDTGIQSSTGSGEVDATPWLCDSFGNNPAVSDGGSCAPPEPETKDDCKEGGYADYGFKNQGQCIRYVNTGKDSR